MNNITKEKYLKSIARETAKMSWPGHMNPIVKAGTKKILEEYFIGTDFPFEELWDGKSCAYSDYDKWHEEQTKAISKKVVKTNLRDQEYEARVVSAKFLNTFMHQLVKYEDFRGLYEHLHLTLDSGVHKEICENSRDVEIQKMKQENTYKISYATYMCIQKDAWNLLNDYNQKFKDTGIKLRSRIDLNAILWAGAAKGKESKN